MLTVSEIAEALTCTRAEFGNIFLQAQEDLGIPIEARVSFESLVTNMADDKAAFAKAMEEAEKKSGFVSRLLLLLAKSGLENGAIARDLLTDRDGNEARLEAISNIPAGFTDPLIYGKGIIKTTQITGKVLVDNEAKGTGVLIGQNLFLTAWHVLSPLFEKKGDGFQPKSNPPSLAVEFSNIVDRVGNDSVPLQPMLVNAHKDWLVCFSPCHDSEQLGKLANPLKELEGFYDYAIIRLSRAVGQERNWARMDEEPPLPEADTSVVLFQHPQGISLKIDLSTIVLPEVPDEAIPGLRFLHSVNSSQGSSGGPCFDKKFELVGIHQGEWPVKIRGKTINRGIPAARIVHHYKKQINELPLPDPADCPVWSIKKMEIEAVIGCDEFQSLVWRSAVTGTKRIIRINGNPKTGKSFHVDVAHFILPDASHMKVLLAGAAISRKSALDLARDICSQSGAALPVFVPFESYNSTPGAWLRDEIMMKMMEALEQRRMDRTVWISFNNLNQFNPEGLYAQDFLLLLMEQTLSRNWLRIILDGIRTELPSSFKEVMHVYRTHELSKQEIETFLKRAFAELQIVEGIKSAAVAAKSLYRRYDGDLNGDPDNALENLAGESINVINDYLESDEE
jgi:hypothetical protein